MSESDIDIETREIANDDNKGRFNKIASILMRPPYAARFAWFDLLRVSCKFATRITKWTKDDDKRLLKVLRYVVYMGDFRQVGFVGDGIHHGCVHLFTDVVFVGGAPSQRSTSEIHLAMHGPHLMFPLFVASKQQAAVAFCTPEVGVVAANEGYRTALVPALSLWEYIAPKLQPPMFPEDNQACILVMRSGRNPTMRHLGRVRRANIQASRERSGPPPQRGFHYFVLCGHI